MANKAFAVSGTGLRVYAQLDDFMNRPEWDGLECLDPSLTQQSAKEDADINTIVRRFGITGSMPVGLVPPTFQDFEDVFDYQSALHVVMDAQDRFMAMPAEVRARFGNDPQRFVEFASDSKNLDAMIEMGLAPKKPEAPKELPAKEPTST